MRSQSGGENGKDINTQGARGQGATFESGGGDRFYVGSNRSYSQCGQEDSHWTKPHAAAACEKTRRESAEAAKCAARAEDATAPWA